MCISVCVCHPFSSTIEVQLEKQGHDMKFQQQLGSCIITASLPSHPMIYKWVIFPSSVLGSCVI